MDQRRTDQDEERRHERQFGERIETEGKGEQEGEHWLLARPNTC